MKIDILTPDIFPKTKIVAGVTLKNQQIFPKTGLTFTISEICPKTEVEKHKAILSSQIGLKYENLKFQHQIHSDIIKNVDHTTSECDSDGMITNKKALALCVKIADCCAILAYDPINQAIGAFHSGWRGTKQRISEKGIVSMIDEFGSKPEDILIYLSPCASGKNYEVGAEVAGHFPKSTISIRNGKYLFDNENEILMQLIDTGIRQKNIQTSGICTIENMDYHSFRRDKSVSGRMVAFIYMK
jgi:polyphenol oxidase